MPSEQVTDEELMERVKAGDEQAFTLLIARYERPLLTFLSRFIGDSHLARDLYQEVFLRVYLNAKEYTPVRKFSAWLYRIAINQRGCKGASPKWPLNRTATASAVSPARSELTALSGSSRIVIAEIAHGGDGLCYERPYIAARSSPPTDCWQRRPWWVFSSSW